MLVRGLASTPMEALSVEALAEEVLVVEVLAVEAIVLEALAVAGLAVVAAIVSDEGETREEGQLAIADAPSGCWGGVRGDVVASFSRAAYNQAVCACHARPAYLNGEVLLGPRTRHAPTHRIIDTPFQRSVSHLRVLVAVRSSGDHNISVAKFATANRTCEAVIMVLVARFPHITAAASHHHQRAMQDDIKRCVSC